MEPQSKTTKNTAQYNSMGMTILIPSKSGRHALDKILTDVYELHPSQYRIYQTSNSLGAKIFRGNGDGHAPKQDARINLYIEPDGSMATVDIYPRLGAGRSLAPNAVMHYIIEKYSLHQPLINTEALNTYLQYASQGYIILQAPIAHQQQPIHGVNTAIVPIKPAQPNPQYNINRIHTTTHNPLNPQNTVADSDIQSVPTKKGWLPKLAKLLFHKKPEAAETEPDTHTTASNELFAKHSEQLLWHSTAPLIVHEGDSFARIIPATQARDAILVTGKTIPSKEVNNNSINAGQGVKIESNIVTATTTGLVAFNNNTFEILPYKTYNKLPPTDKSITFQGGIIINCDVESGYTIKGDAIYIMGSVQSSSLVSTGTLYISHGIAGKGSSIHGTTVHCSYCSQTNIYGDTILIDNYIFNSKIWATQSILTKNTTSISGGMLTFYHNAYLGSIGTPSSSATSMHMGLHYRKANKIYQLKKQALITEVKIHELQELDDNNPHDDMDYPQHVFEQITALKKHSTDLQENIDSLSKNLYNNDFYANIQKIQEGTRIHTPRHTVLSKESNTPVSFDKSYLK